MKEIVVISGKGGSGKTSIIAGLIHLAGRAVVADCDVDAANLHLLIRPRDSQQTVFWGGKKAILDLDRCTRCGACRETCRFGAIVADEQTSPPHYTVDWWACEGCAACIHTCPVNALAMAREKAGVWFESQTAYGPMLHARLDPGAENSGKLVATVRRRAREVAQSQGIPLIFVDGPPGIGCPVIASIAGAAFVLLITEPTIAGEHDLDRALKLVEHFGIPAGVCINRWDLNAERSEALAQMLAARKVPVLGRIAFDPAMVKAQDQTIPITQLTDGGAAADIAALWQQLQDCTNNPLAAIAGIQ